MSMENRTKFLLCPKCGGKTRIQVLDNTELINLPLFCPKCKCECVITYKKGEIEYKKRI